LHGRKYLPGADGWWSSAHTNDAAVKEFIVYGR
jgi:hypothetical protein